MKRFSFLFFYFFLFCASLSAHQTENVFIAVIDGARFTETFGDPSHTYIPKIWNELCPRGTIYTSFYIDGVTSTNPGHASIISGTWQTISNDGTQRPTRPTLFEYFRKQNNVSPSANYVVLGKSKLNILSYSTHGEYGSAYGASVKTSTSQYDDFVTLANVEQVMNSNHPRLVIINFAEVDNKGHAGVWNNYVGAIRKVDSLIYRLWNFIESDSVYAGKTTLFVTNDHGRHTSSFVDHGDNCEGCRHIMLLVMGPDTPAGLVDSTMRKQTDIAPTVGQLLAFETPYSTGSVLASALITDIAAENPPALFPEEVELHPNYPNPFNPATTMSFLLPFSAHTELKIFNMLGEEITSLVNRQLPAGSHQYQWNAMDAAGGVYFYRLSVLPPELSSAAIIKTGKMILLK